VPYRASLATAEAEQARRHAEKLYHKEISDGSP